MCRREEANITNYQRYLRNNAATEVTTETEKLLKRKYFIFKIIFMEKHKYNARKIGKFYCQENINRI